MNNRLIQALPLLLILISMLCATFIDIKLIKIVALLVMFVSLGIIAYQYMVQLRKTEEYAAKVSELKAKMKNYTIFRTAAEKCVKLESRLSALDAVPEVNEEQSLGLQLSRLNNSLSNIIPEYKEKGYEILMDKLAVAVKTEEFINVFRDKSIRPFMDELKHCSMPVSSDDQLRLLSRMIEIAMSSVDVIEVCRDNINTRPEQHLTRDVLYGIKTRDQAYAEAKPITDNPLETPVWARAVKSIAIASNVADKPVLYSGYKIV